LENFTAEIGACGPPLGAGGRCGPMCGAAWRRSTSRKPEKTIRVDVRLLAATHRDLAKMVAAGRFRKDLYYRLNVLPVVVPPPRERSDDIPRLVRYFTHRFARRMGRRMAGQRPRTAEHQTVIEVFAEAAGG